MLIRVFEAVLPALLFCCGAEAVQRTSHQPSLVAQLKPAGSWLQTAAWVATGLVCTHLVVWVMRQWPYIGEFSWPAPPTATGWT